MPTYLWKCPSCEMNVEQYETLANFGKTTLVCWDCHVDMRRLITAPMLVKVSVDVSYDSPIDGKPITSWSAREEDLKRSGCTPYDPAQKQDYDRRVKASEAELDTAIEAHVEEAVMKMDGEGRRRLASELLEQGTTAEVVRTTPHA